MAFRLNDAPTLERPRRRIETSVSNRQWRAPDITSVGRVRLGKDGVGTNSVGRNGIGQAPIGQADIQVIDKGIGEGFHAEWRARNDGEQPGTARLALRYISGGPASTPQNQIVEYGPAKILEPGEEVTLELTMAGIDPRGQEYPDELLFELELLAAGPEGDDGVAVTWHLFVVSYMVAKGKGLLAAERQRWRDAVADAGFTEQEIPFTENWEFALAEKLYWKDSVLSAGLSLGDVPYAQGWENALQRYIDEGLARQAEHDAYIAALNEYGVKSGEVEFKDGWRDAMQTFLDNRDRNKAKATSEKNWRNALKDAGLTEGQLSFDAWLAGGLQAAIDKNETTRLRGQYENQRNLAGLTEGQLSFDAWLKPGGLQTAIDKKADALSGYNRLVADLKSKFPELFKAGDVPQFNYGGDWGANINRLTGTYQTERTRLDKNLAKEQRTADALKDYNRLVADLKSKFPELFKAGDVPQFNYGGNWSANINRLGKSYATTKNEKERIARQNRLRNQALKDAVEAQRLEAEKRDKEAEARRTVVVPPSRRGGFVPTPAGGLTYARTQPIYDPEEEEKDTKAEARRTVVVPPSRRSGFVPTPAGGLTYARTQPIYDDAPDPFGHVPASSAQTGGGRTASSQDRDEPSGIHQTTPSGGSRSSGRTTPDPTFIQSIVEARSRGSQRPTDDEPDPFGHVPGGSDDSWIFEMMEPGWSSAQTGGGRTASSQDRDEPSGIHQTTPSGGSRSSGGYGGGFDHRGGW